jgi:predicted enzyme related to lactoylglutathione lyase
MDGSIRTVMMFCEVPRQVPLWWANLLEVPSDLVHEDVDFSWFNAGGTEYGFHPADHVRNPLGGTPVVYLATQDIHAAVERALEFGATRHRGPLVLSPNRSIAQFVDPFGNVFGIDGS